MLPEQRDTTEQNFKHQCRKSVSLAPEEYPKQVGNILRAHGIKLAHRPAHTLQSELCRVKDKRKLMDRNGVMYSIKCKHCQAEYIGETGKELR